MIIKEPGPKKKKNHEFVILENPVPPEYSVLLDSTVLTSIVKNRLSPPDSSLANENAGLDMGSLYHRYTRAA